MHALSGLLLVVFALVAALVHQRVLAPLDQALMRVVKSSIGADIDFIGGVLTYVAAAEVSVALGIAGSLALRVTGVRGWSALAPLFFVATVPIEVAMKFTLDQPVPSGDLYRESIRYVLLGLPTMQSFPSGHSIRAMFIAVVGTYLAWRWEGRRGAITAGALLSLVVVTSGWTRVYLGHHWPIDVIGGWIFGAAIGVFSVATLCKARDRAGQNAP
ncbi:MAG: phosphatase PAP2 family protein [Chloroflexota bacterium]|nr:MAG: phosphatase PAP2 family protein [Chloroflexota bacterium]